MTGAIWSVPRLTFLSDSFSGATVLLSLTRESGTYGGYCVTISRSGGTSPTNIGFVGTALDMTALNAYLSGGTAFVDTWYDQSGNGNNATASGAARYQIVVAADGLLALVGGAATGMQIADASSHKTAKIDAFVVGKLGITKNDDTAENTALFVTGWTATGADAALVARWALMFDVDALEVPRNAQNGGFRSQRTSADEPSRIPIGNGHRTNYAVWEYSSERVVLRRNDVTLWDDVTDGSVAAADVTYTGTGKLYIGRNGSAGQNGTGMTLRAVVIYGTTRADHAGISSFLYNRWFVTDFPASYTDADGFTYAPNYFPSFAVDASNDANGLRWWYEQGGYPAGGSRGSVPSHGLATNVNNGATLAIYAVGTLDNDTIVNGQERAERGAYIGASSAITSATLNRGDTFEEYFDFKISAPTQSGSWSLFAQLHTDGGPTPDLCFINAKADTLQTVTQRNSADTNRGTSEAIVQDTWYSVRRKITWSSSGTADTYEEWRGFHGTTLTKVANITASAIFPTAADSSIAYVKEGIYRGDPGGNAGTFVLWVANHNASKSANAFASFVATQPALPTHG